MIDNEFPWLLGHQGIVLRKKIPDIHFVKVVAFKPGSRKSEGGLNCNGPQDGKKKSYPTVHPHKSTMSRDPNYCSSFLSLRQKPKELCKCLQAEFLDPRLNSILYLLKLCDPDQDLWPATYDIHPLAI